MVEKDSVTIVTGAASGMGEATARLLVSRGQHVILADIADDRGESIARELGELAEYVHADVTREDDVRNLFERASERGMRLAGAFNNAGIIGARGPIDEMSVEEWDATITVLLRSVFLGIKYAARMMKPYTSGAVVNTASIAAFRGDIGPHAYAAAKAGVVQLTRNAAAELGAWGIRVNAIAPGRTATPMVAAAWAGDASDLDGAREMIRKQTPLRDRIGTAEDIAEAAAWLLSDRAGYVSGQCLVVDGGLLGGSPPADIGLRNAYSSPAEYMNAGGIVGPPTQ